MFEGWLAGARCKVGHVDERFHSMFVMTHFSFLPVIFFSCVIARCVITQCACFLFFSHHFSLASGYVRYTHFSFSLALRSFRLKWCNVATFSKPARKTMFSAKPGKCALITRDKYFSVTRKLVRNFFFLRKQPPDMSHKNVLFADCVGVRCAQKRRRAK